MKIGILTLPQETNYGGILQAFAMQRTLHKLGYDAITIDRHNRKEYSSFTMHIAGYCKRLFLHYLRGKRNISTKWNPFISADDYKSSSVETQKFIDRNLHLTRRIYSDQLEEVDKEYRFDAYVVGSDQVWLDNYCPASFLDFVHRRDVKRVTYAASCGKKSFFNNASKVAKCRELAKSFNGISVRERQLVSKCEEYLGVAAQWVLDPTMLLEPNEYVEATINNVGSTPIIFSYILDSNAKKNALIDFVAKRLNLPIVNGNRIHETGNAGKTYPSVDDWIQNISRASFIVTDSFHGTVFAILFKKPFITFLNKRRGKDRFVSLLELFDIENRLVSVDLSSDSDLEKIIASPIDFDIIGHLLSEKKKESLKFLQLSLVQ